MIVLSGLLVLLSIVLLLIGLLFDSGLGWVYTSIGTSIAAGVFLVLGALQRRGEAVQAPTGAAPATDGYERVTAVTVTRPGTGGDLSGAVAGAAAGAAAGSAASGSGGQLVSVVPGRPRYHTESCRFLAGRSDVTQVPVESARGDGYSACGVCKPDAAPATEPEAAPETAELRAPEEILAETAADDAAGVPAEAVPARKRTATKAPATKAAPAVKAAPARTATAATKAVPAKKTAAAGTAAAKPAKATKTTAAAAPAKAAGATVVVIPDRGKYHVESCRFVRDVPGTVTLSKTGAKRQGYVPCGVCKP